VNLRLIDVRSGKVIYAEEGAGEAEVEAGRVLGLGQDAAYDSTLNDRAISAAISKLVSNILENLMDAPWQTGILTIENGQVFIAGGSEQGLEVGAKLSVKARGKMIKDPQYGGIIELPRKLVATIEVEAFFGTGVDGQGSAYFTFAGDTEGLMLRIDDGDLIPLQSSRREVRYSVPSGKHRVRVMRDKSLVIDRQIFVGRGEGFLIKLP
jgi:hypothetical protein